MEQFYLSFYLAIAAVANMFLFLNLLHTKKRARNNRKLSNQSRKIKTDRSTEATGSCGNNITLK